MHSISIRSGDLNEKNYHEAKSELLIFLAGQVYFTNETVYTKKDRDLKYEIEELIGHTRGITVFTKLIKQSSMQYTFGSLEIKLQSEITPLEDLAEKIANLHGSFCRHR